ncbi:MAG TPA: helix-turn-helix transcriptional regulator [Agromyces mariniharenae]|nr:helix-turn-helix transcriptional regulator [Agromyces mariniharenae]
MEREDPTEYEGGSTTARHTVRPETDVPGMVRRVRRVCDLSQRDLAAALGVTRARVARLESVPQRVEMPLLVEILALAGMRLAVLGHDGVEVVPIAPDAVRDHGGRRMPAHLDLRARSDRPRSTLVRGHAERTDPPAWYHHRAERDRRRLELGHRRETVPDQPTGTQLRMVERSRRARRSVLGPSALTLLNMECSCEDACYELDACRSACSCRCEI